MDTMTVGKRLVELCRAGEHRKAIEELYADDAVSIEAMEGGPKGRVTKGKPALLAGSDWFVENHEIHGGDVDGPYPHDDEFVCFMTMDVTAKQGPFANQRMEMKEAAHYRVKGGKIVESKFYYGFDCNEQ